jgi:hypothetical protein
MEHEHEHGEDCAPVGFDTRYAFIGKNQITLTHGELVVLFSVAQDAFVERERAFDNGERSRDLHFEGRVLISIAGKLATALAESDYSYSDEHRALLRSVSESAKSAVGELQSEADMAEMVNVLFAEGGWGE